jgi:Protein of unknown function (DUF4232)
MKYLSTIGKTARRTTAALAATAAAAGLIALTAVSAAGSPGTVLASGTARTTATSVPACTAHDLGAWVAITQGNGAAGSVYYPLQFTNLSRHACAMRGFPGVSALDRAAHQVGSPAGRDHAVPVRTVVLAPGATAHSVLRLSDVVLSTPGCHPVYSGIELRIYPPDQRRATLAAYDLAACAHAGPVFLHVGPVQAGVGTING